MGRTLRPHLPGAPFHLTARIQGREPLLAGLEAGVRTMILRCSGPAGMRVLSLAVMPNHLHIVAVQGQRPLSWFMHPLLRRAALLVRRVHGGAGHVFERRFHSSPCLDADYLRTAIVYVHLNPVRAGLCAEPGDTECSSHSSYAPVGDTVAALPGASEGLSLFAPHAGAGEEDCRRNYLRFIEWRLDSDRRAAAGLVASAVRAPSCAGGDLTWHRVYAAAAALVEPGVGTVPPKREELSDIARRVIGELAPGLALDMVRLGIRTRPVVSVRNTIIARGLEAGHSPSGIARFLRVSSTTISRVAVKQRLPPSPRADVPVEESGE